MCKFYWCFCYCCNIYKKTVKDSEWCGDVDCSRNDVITKYSSKMCFRCIEIGCYKRKEFCDPSVIPAIINKNKNWMI